MPLIPYWKNYIYVVSDILPYSVGSDNVEQELWESGNQNPRTPHYSVAEHAVTLLLALNRKIILGQNSCKWATTVWIIWLVLTCMKKVGIIGTGKIGGAFAKIMHGFGCQIL
jgi:D-lactate dehydrogenase